MQLNPARGRKQALKEFDKASYGEGFMQLNPARGRKLSFTDSTIFNIIKMVYAAQPREGTETRHHHTRYLSFHLLGLCSSTPRGDGNTFQGVSLVIRLHYRGLCSSTPRGDGNKPATCGLAWRLLITVYAAQPREGTETSTGSESQLSAFMNGLCSSTPRGDGNPP